MSWMSEIGLRPTFSDSIPMDPETARRHLATRMADLAPEFECKDFPGFIGLRMPVNRRRFYSPRLNLSLEANEAGGTRIEGIFGPNASMWSAFLYGYLATISITLFSGILGACQWKLGMLAWGLWIFWTALASVIGLYIAGRIGRHMARIQTDELRTIYQNAAGHRVELH